jgi:threonine aldolase
MSYGMISNQCSCGGRCLSVEYTDKVGELAKKHGLKLHIDGARIFNASIVSKIIFNVLIYDHVISLGANCSSMHVLIEITHMLHCFP